MRIHDGSVGWVSAGLLDPFKLWTRPSPSRSQLRPAKCKRWAPSCRDHLSRIDKRTSANNVRELIKIIDRDHWLRSLSKMIHFLSIISYHVCCTLPTQATDLSRRIGRRVAVLFTFHEATRANDTDFTFNCWCWRSKFWVLINFMRLTEIIV